jgi:hypothetical protein
MEETTTEEVKTETVEAPAEVTEEVKVEQPESGLPEGEVQGNVDPVPEAPVEEKDVASEAPSVPESYFKDFV